MRRDHVAAFAGSELTNIDARHAGAVAGDAEQLNERVAGSCHGVAASIGLNTRVRRTPREGNVELRRAEEAIRIDREFARLAHHGDMRAEEIVRIIDNAGGGHASRAANTFFGRLEEDLELAAEFALVVGEPVRNGKARRHVSVVAAGVHQARARGGKAFLGRNVRFVLGLFDRHAVNVKAHGERRAGAPRIEHADTARVAFHFVEQLFGDAVLAGRFNTRFHNLLAAAEAIFRVDHLRAREHLVAVFAQLADQERRGREFAPAFFREGVKFAANLNQLIVISAGACGHFCSSINLNRQIGGVQHYRRSITNGASSISRG